MRLPLDHARRHDRPGQPDVRALDRATRARSSSGAAASRTCSPPGGRIYHETHYAPLLRMQGSVREIALDLVRADGARLPVLVNSVLRARRARPAARDPHDGVRRDRPAPVRAGAAPARSAASTRSPLRLQRSLLSGALPEATALEVGVAYRPAERGLEVGGDWYDAFCARRRHDRRSSSATSSAAASRRRRRWASCAAPCARWPSTGLAAGAAARRRSTLRGRHAVGRMATLVYAEVDAAAERVTYACAGHPPPVVLEPGAAAALRCGTGAPRRSTLARRPRHARRAASSRAGRAPWCSTPTGWSSAAGGRWTPGSRRCWPASSADAAWTRPGSRSTCSGTSPGAGRTETTCACSWRRSAHHG